MRLHELSLRAHIGMEFGQENPRGGRVIGSLGLPVNLNCGEKESGITGPSLQNLVFMSDWLAGPLSGKATSSPSRSQFRL